MAVQGYEPYIIVSRRFVPWYDERFRGYRKNKVQHLLHLAGMIQFLKPACVIPEPIW